jgi:hypothetical protein
VAAIMASIEAMIARAVTVATMFIGSSPPPPSRVGAPSPSVRSLIPAA